MADERWNLQTNRSFTLLAGTAKLLSAEGTVDYNFTKQEMVDYLDTLYQAIDTVDIVNDTSPQLGGSLDVNGNKIVSTSNGDIDIEPNGTGNVLLGNLTFDAAG